MGLREPCHKILGLEQSSSQGTQVLHRFRLPSARRQSDKDSMGRDKTVLRDNQAKVECQSEDDTDVDKEYLQMVVSPHPRQVEKRWIPDTDRARVDMIFDPR